jgi:ABC-type dipeptide/oligopeptide/nickel transport system permease subunit
MAEVAVRLPGRRRAGSASGPAPGARAAPPPEWSSLELDAFVPYWRDVVRRFLRNRLAVGGVVFVVLVFAAAALAPLLTSWDPTHMDPQGFADLAPSKRHWLGTDRLGRDLFARMLFGARTSLSVAVGVALVSTALALLIGAVAGYCGGWVDALLMRSADVVSALPYIAVIFFMVERFGRTTLTIVAAIVVIGWMGSARLFRAGVYQVKSEEYIEAARAAGCTGPRIVWRHIAPNAIQPIIVSLAFGIGAGVL